MIMFLLLLTACTQNQKINMPSYMQFQTAKLAIKEIETDIKVNMPKEIARLFGFPIKMCLEEWIERNLTATGIEGKANVRIELELEELGINEYRARLGTEIEFKNSDNNKIYKKIYNTSNGFKHFDKGVSFAQRKKYLYDLIQDLIQAAHEGLLNEISK